MACVRGVRVIPVLSACQGLKTCLSKLIPLVEFKEIDPVCFHYYLEVKEDLSILKASEIIICDPEGICPYLYELTNTKWIQGTWAGVEVYKKYIDISKPKLPFQITRFSGPSAFGYRMGEYLISQIVMHERELIKVRQNQMKKLWSREGKIMNHRSLADLTVGVLGLGAIGKEIAHILKVFNAKVWVLIRSAPSGSGKLACVDEFRKIEELPELLSSCDYVCNVLPSTSETIGILGNGMLKNCQRKGTVFVNIGRGSIISERELIEALDKEWISGAILDVFEEEPLSPTSPLWSMPQVSITPHVSGVTNAQDVAQLFAKNLKHYDSGLPLEYVYDPEKEY
ncbi:hypothetical protein J437_LFUL000657 [Ladona fulva]|uniref:D-isomer specific 2-hydroxyacid dehydrogenase NAD-binding domain-containing protein n=1 Tax=Ladona fulva TaxID=123851 RepID=A0A8K0NZK7_LADFU|nr:hypothetical protein J437_LFUL000657 [Ladona fulva]